MKFFYGKIVKSKENYRVYSNCSIQNANIFNWENYYNLSLKKISDYINKYKLYNEIVKVYKTKISNYYIIEFSNKLCCLIEKNEIKTEKILSEDLFQL